MKLQAITGRGSSDPKAQFKYARRIYRLMRHVDTQAICAAEEVESVKWSGDPLIRAQGERLEGHRRRVHGGQRPYIVPPGTPTCGVCGAGPTQCVGITDQETYEILRSSFPQ